MNKKTICFVGEFPKQLIAKNAANYQTNFVPMRAAKLGEDSFFTAIKNADAIISRSGCLFDARALSRASKLKLLIKAGAGIDQIDQEYCAEHDITVRNTPGANATSVAELAIGLMISLARHIPCVHVGLTEGKWMKNDPVGEEIYGKTVLIVGFGYIGRRVATLLRPFNVHLVVYDPTLSPEEKDYVALEQATLTVNFDEALRHADYVLLHPSYNPTSHEMIDMENLSYLKKGVKIINLARGSILERAAALRGLDEGIIGALAIDTWWEEPVTDTSLRRYPNVIMTPHIGANTREAINRTTTAALDIVQNHFHTYANKGKN